MGPWNWEQLPTEGNTGEGGGGVTEWTGRIVGAVYVSRMQNGHGSG